MRAMSVEQIRGLLASIPGGDINLVVLESQTMTRYYYTNDNQVYNYFTWCIVGLMRLTKILIWRGHYHL